MPAARRKTSSSASKGRKAAPKGPRRPKRPRLPDLSLEPHQLDLLALAAIAGGVFLAFVLYAGVAGGELGDAVTSAGRWLVGLLVYAAPVALVLGGALVLGRELLPAVRPVRTGALCLVTGLALALAGGTLGLGPGDPRPPVLDPAGFRPRGGALGDALLWVLTTLVSDLGAHIVAVFLLLAAVLLLSGATVAGLLRGAHASVSDTGRALRRRAGPAPAPELPPRFVLPPEPEGEELRVSAPAWEDDEDDVTVALEPEPEPEPVAEEDETLVLEGGEDEPVDEEPVPEY